MDRAQTKSSGLAVLQDEIAGRTAAIAAEAGDWPCRRGCDSCCRHLACLPELRAAEWALLEDGIASLDGAARRQVERRLEEIAGGVRPPYVCPFLDPAAGACLVYEHRPIACRTYGFYLQRGVGSYCSIIRERVESGGCEGVVWGNHEVIDSRLSRLGPAIPMKQWLQRRAAMR